MRRMERSAYQRTELRLYAMPALIKKVESDKEELKRLEDGGQMPERSKDIVRFSRGGSRISAEEKLDAKINDMRATIAADEYEISTMQHALHHIESEFYYNVIPNKYFGRLSDEEIAEQFPCDPSTVRRQKSRLVTQISIYLYGSEALA